MNDVDVVIYVKLARSIPDLLVHLIFMLFISVDLFIT